MIVIAEAAKENSTEISGSDVADEFEVAEVEVAVGGEIGGGSDGGPVGIGFAVGARVEVGDFCGRCNGGDGGDAIVEA